jgi:hypothetical protein
VRRCHAVAFFERGLGVNNFFPTWFNVSHLVAIELSVVAQCYDKKGTIPSPNVPFEDDVLPVPEALRWSRMAMRLV